MKENIVLCMISDEVMLTQILPTCPNPSFPQNTKERSSHISLKKVKKNLKIFLINDNKGLIKCYISFIFTYCYLHCIVCHTCAAGCILLPANVTCLYRNMRLPVTYCSPSDVSWMLYFL